jgi:hypothetical protein
MYGEVHGLNSCKIPHTLSTNVAAVVATEQPENKKFRTSAMLLFGILQKQPTNEPYTFI